ncbi:MAG: hypothetical protein MJ076_05625 [Clostridia bacterium]|nr:hypothetical protein [Clostridia bacterium]
MDEEKQKNFNTFTAICITEAILVTVLILSIYIIKTFAPSSFGKIKKWYNANFLTETSVSEVIGSDADEV